MWNYNMMGWGWGSGPYVLLHLIWWVLVVVAIVMLVRFLFRIERRVLRSPSDHDRALSILRERYARGEIDKSEFEARKHDLA
jgi:putative membrane protein